METTDLLLFPSLWAIDGKCYRVIVQLLTVLNNGKKLRMAICLYLCAALDPQANEYYQSPMPGGSTMPDVLDHY